MVKEFKIDLYRVIKHIVFTLLLIYFVVNSFNSCSFERYGKIYINQEYTNRYDITYKVVYFANTTHIGEFNDKEYADYYFLIINIEIVNNNYEQYTVDIEHFTLINNGYEYLPFISKKLEKSLSKLSVNPKMRKNFNIVFEIPNTTFDECTYKLQCEFFKPVDDPAIFNIRQPLKTQ